MQGNNAKDDAVGGGPEASSQPIAPAVAGQAPPQPAGKSIPKSPRRGAGILRGVERRWRKTLKTEQLAERDDGVEITIGFRNGRKVSVVDKCRLGGNSVRTLDGLDLCVDFRNDITLNLSLTLDLHHADRPSRHNSAFPIPLFTFNLHLGFARSIPRQFCYNTHSVRVRTLKITTFQHKSERTTTHLSGCVVASSFFYAPVVGVKVGGDAAAHPVFCCPKSLTRKHRHPLKGIPFAARRHSTVPRLQTGMPTSHPRTEAVVDESVLCLCGRFPSVSLLPRIIAQAQFEAGGE